MSKSRRFFKKTFFVIFILINICLVSIYSKRIFRNKGFNLPDLKSLDFVKTEKIEVSNFKKKIMIIKEYYLNKSANKYLTENYYRNTDASATVYKQREYFRFLYVFKNPSNNKTIGYFYDRNPGPEKNSDNYKIPVFDKKKNKEVWIDEPYGLWQSSLIIDLDNDGIYESEYLGLMDSHGNPMKFECELILFYKMNVLKKFHKMFLNKVNRETSVIN